MSKRLAYYITAHGYGHGVRSCDVMRALMRTYPEIEIHVVSELPESFVSNRLPHAPLQHRSVSLDVGMVQLDSVRVDVDATLDRVTELAARHDDGVEQERRWLTEQGIDLVVCDIPSIPIAAASSLGLPALAVGNFCWDWIYEPFRERDERWTKIVQLFRSDYGQSDLLLRLPFAAPMDAFPHQRDVPLLSRPVETKREEMAKVLGVDAGKKWALLSFTTLDLGDAAIRRMNESEGWLFFTVKPLEWPGDHFVAVDREVFGFETVLASCDVVITKPGYGILSESVANQKPMIYVEREDFVEYPVLEAAVKKYLKHVHIPSEMLYAGDLSSSLEQIISAPEPMESLELGGDGVIADYIAKELGWAS